MPPLSRLAFKKFGPGTLPRYGSGWQHQFGHVYHLQSEMLGAKSDWFRACEMWHTARSEGVAMNIAHYNGICAQLVAPGRWSTALELLRCMRSQALRPDATLIATAAAACVEGQRSDVAVELVNHYTSVHNMRPNDRMRHVLAVALQRRDAALLSDDSVRQLSAPGTASPHDTDSAFVANEEDVVLVPVR
eukprot:CAMPEP_0174853618 /NCGR_PEP_ID=MMETSP1114-20130205/29166_1 /TAXON_ID=312471 /ORGANISM="Neobodo designis, Strain CCAP 1951/1" /LENGTH=189 /DNA_ID=CAMNT_0016088275 /DNA_START=21 /DNA_END=586 /DNA_ORIENTATION=+